MLRPEITFVYNSKTGIANVLIDIFHKMISPDTYQCNLCKLTHDNFGKKQDFKKFLEEDHIDIRFYYKDEYEKKFGQGFEYPFVKISIGNKDIFIKRSVINNFKDFSELQTEIKKQIDNLFG